MLKCVSWVWAAVLLCHVLPAQAQSEKGKRLLKVEPDLGLLNLQIKWDDSLADLVAKCRKIAGDGASVKLDEIDLRDAKTAEDLFRLIAESNESDTTVYNQIEKPVNESLGAITISPVSMLAVKGVKFQVTLDLNSSPGFVVLFPEKSRLTDDAEFLTPYYLETVWIKVVYEEQNQQAFGHVWHDYMKTVDRAVRPSGVPVEYFRDGEGFMINLAEGHRKLYTMGLRDLDDTGNPEVHSFNFRHVGPQSEATLEQAYRRMVKQRLVR